MTVVREKERAFLEDSQAIEGAIRCVLSNSSHYSECRESGVGCFVARAKLFTGLFCANIAIESKSAGALCIVRCRIESPALIIGDLFSMYDYILQRFPDRLRAELAASSRPISN